MQITKEIESKVCNCKSRFNLSGWSLDTSTGYWIHRNDRNACDKPSRFCSVFECDGCDELFFAERPPKNAFLGVLCPECKEWE